jgi:ABC-type glycerol-3-phosphate transport system substrate-binding protein
MVYGWAWGVNKNRPETNKMVAWDFVRFMLSKPDEWLAKAGFVQPVKGVGETEVAKKFPVFDVHMKDVQTASWYLRSERREIAQAVGRPWKPWYTTAPVPRAQLDAAQAAVSRRSSK